MTTPQSRRDFLKTGGLAFAGLAASPSRLFNPARIEVIEMRSDIAGSHVWFDPIEQSGETLACGHCDSCLLRKRGFIEANVPDPTHYAADTSPDARDQ